jgi:hypothetical protein
MLARSSGMAWHGAEIPPIPCNIHSVTHMTESLSIQAKKLRADEQHNVRKCFEMWHDISKNQDKR